MNADRTTIGACLTAVWVLGCGVIAVPASLLAAIFGVAAIPAAFTVWQNGDIVEAIAVLGLVPAAVWTAGIYVMSLRATVLRDLPTACGLAPVAALSGFGAFFAVAWLGSGC